MITPTTAARPVCTASASAVTAPVAREPRPVESVRLPTDAEAYAPCRPTPSGQRTNTDELRADFGDVYGGRTVLVTGADGFMGSHLTDALVELGANVHAFVRATSSGALNNIGHLRNRLKVHFADLTDRTSIDYLVRELQGRAGSAVRLPPRCPGARRRVVAPTLRDGDGEHDRDAQPAPVRSSTGASSSRSSTPPAHRRSTGTSARTSPTITTSTRRRARPARALADQPEIDLRDREGRRRLPHDELPRRVRRAGRRHADVQQLRAASEPSLRHRHDHHAGVDEARDRARRARAAARLLLLHRRRARPSDRRRPRRARATSTSTGRARTSRCATGST